MSQRYVTNQAPKANSVFHSSGVGKWVPSLAEKAKAGMVYFVSRCTRGVQVKLWDPLRMRAIPERLGVITTERYTNPRLPLPLPLSTNITGDVLLQVLIFILIPLSHWSICARHSFVEASAIDLKFKHTRCTELSQCSIFQLFGNQTDGRNIKARRNFSLVSMSVSDIGPTRTNCSDEKSVSLGPWVTRKHCSEAGGLPAAACLAAVG